jgi:hypothetical protein
MLHFQARTRRGTCVPVLGCQSLGETTTVVSQRIGDKNILPYIHIVPAYPFGLAFVPNALIY